MNSPNFVMEQANKFFTDGILTEKTKTKKKTAEKRKAEME